MFTREILNVGKIPAKELRKFGVIFSVILILIFGLFLPWLFSASLPLWPWIVALIIVATALIRPQVLWFLYKPWMIFGGIMGIINSKIILSIVFFLLLLPISLVFKLRGKDLLDKKIQNEKASYWTKSEQQPVETMRNIY